METFDYERYKLLTRGAESSGNDSAKSGTSSASGRYQFVRSTWENYGYDWKDRFNPKLQEEAMRRLTEDNVNYFRRKFKKEPTFRDVYGMHMLGMGDFGKLYSLNDNDYAGKAINQKSLSANKVLQNKSKVQVFQYFDSALSRGQRAMSRNRQGDKSYKSTAFQNTGLSYGQDIGKGFWHYADKEYQKQSYSSPGQTLEFEDDLTMPYQEYFSSEEYIPKQENFGSEGILDRMIGSREIAKESVTDYTQVIDAKKEILKAEIENRQKALQVIPQQEIDEAQPSYAYLQDSSIFKI